MNLPELVDPVIVCFNDQDARVRYYACESLYNISKVARSAVLVFFNKIFDGLCNVSTIHIYNTCRHWLTCNNCSCFVMLTRMSDTVLSCWIDC